jgi:hypothetical protein
MRRVQAYVNAFADGTFTGPAHPMSRMNVRVSRDIGQSISPLVFIDLSPFAHLSNQYDILIRNVLFGWAGTTR